MITTLYRAGEKLLTSIGTMWETITKPLSQVAADVGLDISGIAFLKDLNLLWLVIGSFGIFIIYTLLKWATDIIL